MKIRLSFDSSHTLVALVSAFVMTIGAPTNANADTLETAKSLADHKFKDWTYGSSAAEKQIDCVQFVLAVVEAELKSSLSKEIRDAILINYGWSPTEIQIFAAAGTEAKLGGVHNAIVNLAKRGISVKAADAKPGDLIQYWMKKSDGTWFGHSGVISSITDGYAVIYGAHASANRICQSNEIGKNENGVDKSFSLKLDGSNRHIYTVRLSP